MLKELNLQPVYDSECYDLIRDLQVPLLLQSKDYLRGVGFFTSGWLRLAAQGMATFVTGGGSARIVVSPILDEADWEALKFGETAKTDSILRETLAQNITEEIYKIDHRITSINITIDKLNAPICNFTGNVGVNYLKSFS